MSNYIVDGADLTSVANAIRTKGGTSAQLAFPAGFVSAIEAIETGGGGDERFFTDTGVPYTEHLDYPAAVTYFTQAFGVKFTNLKSITGLAATVVQSPGAQFKSTPNLETVILPRGRHFYNQAFASCPKLKTVELGSVGYPVLITRTNLFQYDTQALTITMYVNASTREEALAMNDVGTNAPWGAANATIIFRSSETGEVLV